MIHVGAAIGRPKASLAQRVDFPVSGENVCEADKRGLGVAERQRGRRELTPPVKNQRFLTAPSKRGGRDGIIVGEGLDPPLTIWEGNVQIGVTRQKICHPEDGCPVRGNLPVGYRLYISTNVAVQLYREIAPQGHFLALCARAPRRFAPRNDMTLVRCLAFIIYEK